VAKTEEGQTLVDEAVDTEDVESGAEEEAESTPKMNLTVSLENSGPCRKHVRVTIPREDIDGVLQASVDELMESADVPGFRSGHVPEALIRKRFKTELAEQVKQKVLMQSLEQISEEQKLDPINEPNLDLDSIEVPEEGDFEYEFDIEVRPEFELPEYKGLEIQRPTREIGDEDVEAYTQEFLEQYGQLEPVDAPARAGDFVIAHLTVTHDGKPLKEFDEITLRVRPILRFQEAEYAKFDELMVGAAADDVREADIQVSLEAENIAMRGETVHTRFEVLDVKRLRLPALDDEFLDRIGVESAEDFKEQVRNMLERQTTYQQRQSTRRQVLDKITESADWELPEELVQKQVENALRREVLEMQQAGFTTREIRARENELRQRSLSMTRQNLKEHFVLDRIATQENIEVSPSEIDVEIALMAMQSGENPRRVRARMQKSGVLENLHAQIRERKAVDVILDHATFIDTPMEAATEPNVEAVDRSLCSTIADTEVENEEADEE
jgi:trigger factor